MTPLSSRTKYDGKEWDPLQEEPEETLGTMKAENVFEDGLKVSLGDIDGQDRDLGNRHGRMYQILCCYLIAQY